MNKSTEEKIDQVLELVIEASSDAIEKRLAKHHKREGLKQYAIHLMDNLKGAEHMAEAKVKDAAAKVKKTALKVHEHAHEKPWFYVAGAAIGGLVLGLLCRRRGS